MTSGLRVGIFALACGTAACAVNRAQVKSLNDLDAARIQFEAPIATTVSALNSLSPRCGPAGNRRVRLEELNVYQVTGKITRVTRQRDHDLHIVLADLEHPRDHLVVESDDPDFRKNAVSPYRERLAAGRRMLDALLADAGIARMSDLQGTIVTVTGVGFFDVNHFQVGRSRSCIELHPLLSIRRAGESTSRSTPVLRLRPDQVSSPRLSGSIHAEVPFSAHGPHTAKNVRYSGPLPHRI